MDQTPSPNPLPGVQRVPVPASSMPEYWDNGAPMYPNSDTLHAHPPQQQQQQPTGISWDHPIFAQQNRQQGHGSPQDQDHGIYSTTLQSWQPDALDARLISPAPSGFGLAPQYQPARQYSHGNGQASLDSQSVNPPESASFAPYPFSQNYYPSQRLAVPDTFTQQTPMQSVSSHAPQLSQYQPNTDQRPLPQYSRTPIPFTAGYAPGANVSDDRTINPQFLNAPQQTPTAQHPTLQGNFLYVNPADFERQDNGKRLNLYPQGLQVPPALGPGGTGQFQHMQNILPVQQPVNITGLQKQKSVPKAQSSKTKEAKIRATGKKPNASPSSESDSGDSDLEVQEADEPSPIPPTRPVEAVAAAEYDTLRAVWSPRNRPPHVDKVKSALVTFKDVVKAIRDAWKESVQKMKTAENKGETDAAAKIKADVILRRRVISAVVTTALEKGHPRIVEKLGEHPMAVSALYSFLLDRHQAADVDGELTVNVLKLLARFTTVDEDVLQKTNVAKLLPRLSKKGGQTVKALSQEILDNAAASTKRKQGQETAKSPPKEEPARKSPTSNPASSDKDRPELAGSKRPRDGESNGLPSTKRVLVTSQTKNGTQPTGSGTGAAKTPQEAGQDGKGAATASRPKANIVAPKPTNLFGSLSSASKRPGTSNAERAAAAAKAGNGSSPEKKDPPPAPKPTFSFGDLMADLNRQKSPVPAEPVENKTPETEEERERRLRKEHRRKLRVSWKPDATLTEVRLFTHDPDEELGPGDRSTGDIKGEGSVLKLHRGLDDLEDEEEGGIQEETLRDYRPLAGIDFGEISADDHARNFIKRAGSQHPVSPEKEAQERREATTLMVFYTSPADVPSSPKEAPPPDQDEMVPDEATFGDVPDLVKARQDHYRSPSQPQPAPSSQPGTQNNQYDISNLLRIIQGVPQQQQSTPAPQPVSQPPMSDLERTINMFRQQQQQPPQLQPQAPQNPTTQAPATQGFDFQRLLAVVNAQQQVQQPQVSQPQVMPQSQPSQPGVAPNVAAIISQFANQNQQSGANHAQQPSQVYEDPERKRMREENGYDSPYDDQSNQAKRSKQVGLTKHPKAGLVPCRYWREGRCVKGNECTFRHDPR